MTETPLIPDVLRLKPSANRFFWACDELTISLLIVSQSVVLQLEPKETSSTKREFVRELGTQIRIFHYFFFPEA